jgi:uncharacterized membrane protein YedE/YeeE
LVGIQRYRHQWISILLLVWLFRQEGKRYLEIFRFERETFWKDLALAIGALVLAGAIASIPSTTLAERIFGSWDVPVAMMFRPLPIWAILAGFLFPLTIALAELPTYFDFYLGLLLKFRPRLLPYLAIGHFLIDILALSVYFTL